MNDYMACRRLCTLYKRRAKHLATASRAAHWAAVAQGQIDAILFLSTREEDRTRDRLRRERERLERKLEISGVSSTPAL
jgi:hypothetical protein